MKRLSLLIVLGVTACGSSGPSKPSYFAIPLTTPDQTFWSPTITNGGQSFVMDLDTGSTTTAIAGTSCTTCTNVSPEYTPGSMAVDQHMTATTEYADGTGWMGEIYQDTINLGSGSPDATFNLVDISTQVVSGGESGFFDGENDYQGILGMGPPENAEPDTGAYFDTITTKSGVDALMAFELCDDGGTMWLGGFDETHAGSAVQYTPILPISTNNAFYSIDITSMSLNGTNVGMGSDAFQEPVLDTGTTFYYLPTNVAQALTAAINASPAFQTMFPSQTLDVEAQDISCVSATGVTDDMVDAMLPPLQFSVPNIAGGADISFSVAPLESYLFDGGNGQFCLGIGDGGDQFGGVLGDQFLQAFVSVIDLANNQIGFAPDKGCSASSSKRRARDVKTLRPHLPKPRLRK
jgi:Eukaryotic aspartyl protease